MWNQELIGVISSWWNILWNWNRWRYGLMQSGLLFNISSTGWAFIQPLSNHNGLSEPMLTKFYENHNCYHLLNATLSKYRLPITPSLLDDSFWNIAKSTTWYKVVFCAKFQMATNLTMPQWVKISVIDGTVSFSNKWSTRRMAHWGVWYANCNRLHTKSQVPLVWRDTGHAFLARDRMFYCLSAVEAWEIPAQ